MRWAAAIAGVVLVLLAGAVAGASPSNRPALLVTSVDPLKVRAAGFQPGERLAVLRATGRGEVARGAGATPAGTFRLVWPVFAINRCSDAIVLQARGDRGGRIAERLSRLPRSPAPLAAG